MHENAQMALDAINRKHTKGIPVGLIHIMEHCVIERLANAVPGSYKKDPHGVYLEMQRNIGTCMIDQYLAENPISMGDDGYESATDKKATTGAEKIFADGMEISSPDDAVQHMEEYIIPSLERSILHFNPQNHADAAIADEINTQKKLGPEILKTGYAHIVFPSLLYGLYGYENYFCAYAMYPEIIDKVFNLQADLAYIQNKAVVEAYIREGLPLYHRLDHDMADSRGLLVNEKTLERAWVPGFIKAIKPAADAGFTLLWHCDGNLMKLIPYLLEAGVNGFQGFQYEDGMDYIEISKLRSKKGESMVIQAGVSVTRELPFGTKDDVVRQIKFLAENGPETGLFLSFSSSCAPKTPYENIKTAIDGIQYYKTHGRG